MATFPVMHPREDEADTARRASNKPAAHLDSLRRNAATTACPLPLKFNEPELTPMIPPVHPPMRDQALSMFRLKARRLWAAMAGAGPLRVVMLCLALASLLSASCSWCKKGDGPPPPSSDIYANLPVIAPVDGAAVVGAAGGHIVFSAQITLDVPAGALTGDVRMTARAVTARNDIVPDLPKLGPAIELHPSGTTFAVPVRLQTAWPRTAAGEPLPADAFLVLSVEDGTNDVEELEFEAGPEQTLRSWHWHFTDQLPVGTPDPSLQVGKVSCVAMDDENKEAMAKKARTSTLPIRKLRWQIAEELDKLSPGALTCGDALIFTKAPCNVDRPLRVRYLMQPAVLTALTAALGEPNGQAKKRRLPLTSAWRSVADQYLLKHVCNNANKTAETTRSNHLSGIGVDLDSQPEPGKPAATCDYQGPLAPDDAPALLGKIHPGWGEILEKHQFRWLARTLSKACADPPHFDYQGPNTKDIRALGLVAFQRLWYRHHSCDDPIPEVEITRAKSGAVLYEKDVPATLERIRMSPAAGFPDVSWQSESSGTAANLTGLGGSDAGNIWAVGDEVILRRVGCQWVVAGGAANQMLKSVTVPSPSSGFATGYDRITGQGLVLEFRNGSWNRQGMGLPFQPTGVWGRPGGQPFLYGSGGFRIWDGTAWLMAFAELAEALKNEVINGVFSAEDGTTVLVGARGTILRTSGPKVIRDKSGVNSTLNAVWGSSIQRVWAVGSSGVILSFNGQSWEPQASGTREDLLGIWGRDASHVWAVGNLGTILFFDGKTWQLQPSGTTQNLAAVWGSERGDVWTVGRAGTILHSIP